ncbi:glycosyltransferase family 2 protein [Geothermobacter ehrlichii]|nr:glycosyltransferase family 2 protein [Geothermobacter ehrlichii]
MSVAEQCLQPDRILIVDSSGSQMDLSPYQVLDAEVVKIPRQDFDHGGTRNLALDVLSGCDVIVYLTQDAVFASRTSLRNLMCAFRVGEVSAAYGRHVPWARSSAIARHARLYNYPDRPSYKVLADASEQGIKAIFMSNAFAAYRLSALKEIGGFRAPVIMGEDMEAAARLLLAGCKIAYVAEARVYHSHEYGLRDEFRRYFDIGVFHREQGWILKRFGRAEGEGRRFVRSELSYLRQHAPWRIPEALLRTCLKYLGYRAGKNYHVLPESLLPKLSMNRNYWPRRRVA